MGVRASSPSFMFHPRYKNSPETMRACFYLLAFAFTISSQSVPIPRSSILVIVVVVHPFPYFSHPLPSPPRLPLLLASSADSGD